MIAAVARSPERVAGEKQKFRIFRRKNYWLGAQHSKILRLHRHRQNVLRLPRTPIESRKFAPDDDVVVERIGDDVTVFLGRDRLPIAESDLALVAAAFDSDRTAFLLPAVKPIRKSIVCADVIQLRGR